MNKFYDYSSKELKDLINSKKIIATLSIGSIEQHGNHLPLSVDFDIANEIAKRICELHNTDMIYLPPIYYGARSLPQSGGVNDNDSSISLSGITLIHMFSDILISLYRIGLRHMIIINAHYENELFICEAAEKLKSEIPGFKLIILSWWNLISDKFINENIGDRFAGWDREHAGYCETSIMLYLYPEKVRYINEIYYQKGIGGIYDNFFYLNNDKPNIGVLSSSLGANAQIGEKMFNIVIDELERIIAELK